MADCFIRRRDESWIEVVLPTPSYAGEFGKAHNIMLGELGLDSNAGAGDDVYAVKVGDDEIILRAKAPLAGSRSRGARSESRRLSRSCWPTGTGT